MYIQLSDIPAIHPPAYAVHVFPMGVHRQHAHHGGKERRYMTGCGIRMYGRSDVREEDYGYRDVREGDSRWNDTEIGLFWKGWKDRWIA